MNCPKCGAPRAAGHRCAPAAPGAGRTARPRPVAARPKKKNSLLYGLIAAGVFGAFIVVTVVLLQKSGKAGRQLADASERHLQTERQANAPAPKPTSGGYSLHRDASFGFTVPIPEGWVKEAGQEADFALLLTRTDRKSGVLMVSVENPLPDLVQGKMGWEVLTQSVTQSFQDVKVDRRENGTCVGHRAHLMTVSCRAQGSQKRMMYYLVATPRQIYMLNWTASPEYYDEPLFERTVKAFVPAERP